MSNDVPRFVREFLDSGGLRPRRLDDRNFCSGRRSSRRRGRRREGAKSALACARLMCQCPKESTSQTLPRDNPNQRAVSAEGSPCGCR
jgi:hypothetical protein